MNAGQTDDVALMRQRMDDIANELESVEKLLSNTINQDEGTWLRMLMVVSHLLQHTRFNLQHPGIAGLLEVFYPNQLNHRCVLIHESLCNRARYVP
jgi:hypothetical protein